MKIVDYNNTGSIRWDDACIASSQAWLYHRSGWIDIEASYNNYINHSFAIVSGESILAIQPLYQSSLGLGSWTESLLHSGIHRHTGLATVDGLNQETLNSIFSLTLNNINNIAKMAEVDRIQLNIQTLSPATSNSKINEVPFWIKREKYHLGLGFGPSGIAPAPGVSTACYDQVVRLCQSEYALFSNLDDSTRRAVRKAQKAGLEYFESSNSPVEEYYNLALKSALRSGEQLQSQKYYQHIWDQFSASKNCVILIASHFGKNVAALFLLSDKHAISFMGGVSDPEYLTMRVNDYLHWSAIKWANEQGYTSYRLGPYFPELPEDWHICKIAKFKTKFGAQSIPILQGSYFRNPDKYVEIGCNYIKLLSSCKV
jgi:hypothetical protein